MKYTQPAGTTHQVMHRVIYFEAYVNVINGIKERSHQPNFEIYKHAQNVFINVVNQDFLSTLKEMYERIFIGRV